MWRDNLLRPDPIDYIYSGRAGDVPNSALRTDADAAAASPASKFTPHSNLESKIIFGIYVSAGQRVPCQPFKTLLTCWAIVAAIEVECGCSYMGNMAAKRRPSVCLNSSPELNTRAQFKVAVCLDR